MHSDVEISTSYYVLPLNVSSDEEISTSYYVLPLNVSSDGEISTSLFNIDKYMTLFEENCNCDNLKMAALGRNM